jgi:Ca2+-binding EF-hand superfamily protein
MYKKVNMQEPDKRELVTDASGYTGVFNRKKIKLQPITLLEFFREFERDDRMKEIYLKIRQIDKDRNGFITHVELDDIIKESYATLADRDLSEIIKPFCSPENAILTDYKGFSKFLVANLKALKETGKLVETKSDDA